METEKPIIALTVSTHIEETGEVVANPSIKAMLEELGAQVRPIDFKKVETADIPQLMQDVSGVVFPGGGDMDPAVYGRVRIPECGEPDAKRDGIEIAMYKEAAKLGVPMFGICRGCQLLNVFFGGTLIQDLPSERGVKHNQGKSPCKYYQFADIAEGTRLREALGVERLMINSWHHQAVDEPAPGFTVNAVSVTDGIIEGIESAQDSVYVLGVQWHPESVPDDPASKAVFRSFMDAVNKNRR